MNKADYTMDRLFIILSIMISILIPIPLVLEKNGISIDPLGFIVITHLLIAIQSVIILIYIKVPYLIVKVLGKYNKKYIIYGIMKKVDYIIGLVIISYLLYNLYISNDEKILFMGIGVTILFLIYYTMMQKRKNPLPSPYHEINLAINRLNYIFTIVITYFLLSFFWSIIFEFSYNTLNLIVDTGSVFTLTLSTDFFYYYDIVILVFFLIIIVNISLGYYIIKLTLSLHPFKLSVKNVQYQSSNLSYILNDVLKILNINTNVNLLVSKSEETRVDLRGGQIVITVSEKDLKKLSTTEELKAIMAHELTHYKLDGIAYFYSSDISKLKKIIFIMLFAHILTFIFVTILVGTSPKFFDIFTKMIQSPQHVREQLLQIILKFSYIPSLADDFFVALFASIIATIFGFLLVISNSTSLYRGWLLEARADFISALFFPEGLKGALIKLSSGWNICREVRRLGDIGRGIREMLFPYRYHSCLWQRLLIAEIAKRIASEGLEVRLIKKPGVRDIVELLLEPEKLMKLVDRIWESGKIRLRDALELGIEPEELFYVISAMEHEGYISLPYNEVLEAVDSAFSVEHAA